LLRPGQSERRSYYIAQKDYRTLEQTVTEVKRMLTRFIQRLTADR
jgi:hypothetical protein